MHVYFYWFYSLPTVGWEENATKVTNVASKDRLMVASYCYFTIFPTWMILNVYAISIVAIAPLATISLLLLLSNFPFQTFKHTYS